MALLVVQEIRPGLWRWSAPHPEWKPEKGGPGGWEQMVGSVYCETPEAVVLLDPLAPPAATGEHARFFAALDRDVHRVGRPVAILLGNRYHVRSARELYERYRGTPGASVWAHATVQLDCPVTDRLFQGVLPGGLRAIPLTGLNPDEVAFYLPEHRAVVVADSILGAGDGKLRIAPASWADAAEDAQSRYRARFRDELRRLLDVPVDMALVSHGEPILANGGAALAAALDAPPWGECG